MNKCMSCNKTLILGKKIGNTIICKNCADLIEYSSWNDRCFSSFDELVEMKKHVVQLANNNGIKKEVINSIEDYFNEYVDAEFAGAVDGKSGQILTVFSDYCILNIKNDSAKSSADTMFREFILEEDEEYEDDDDEILSTDDKIKIAKSFLTGNIVKTGITVATSKVIQSKAKEELKELKEEKKEKEICRNIDKILKIGDKIIDLKNIRKIEYFNKNNKKGYLKFIPNGISEEEIYKSEYFFFKDNIPFMSKNIGLKVDNIYKILNDKITKIKSEISKENEEKERITKEKKEESKLETKKENMSADSFELIKKYKDLLDEGIISVEEFDKKKKELLNL